jgi:hypothetical protein
MYLAFLNLPREVRQGRENVLLVGVIPDMKSEPKTNTFLKPLVQELKQTWGDVFFYCTPINLTIHLNVLSLRLFVSDVTFQPVGNYVVSLVILQLLDVISAKKIISWKCRRKKLWWI